MSESKQLAKFAKNSMEDIIVSESEFKGKYYIDIRIWVKKDGDEKDLIPTKKGVSIDKESWPDLLEVLKKIK